ncbi:membrane protein [Thalictrum thalictroides]|uniref:Membrane protein n=1 Tax=Thalictrum thalictroides TaxID=46969 RepID=A0A7J6W4Y4_THATH|nr:membrane protein [Thalictrum thalictroides]
MSLVLLKNKMVRSPLNCLYVIFAFFSALVLGAVKGVLVGPIAALILIIGQVGVILGLFPFHVASTIYTIGKTKRFDLPLKIAILFALPGLFGLWLGLGIACSVLVAVGYGFFTPWISTFEAFRQERSRKFYHCIVDGTLDTIKGSCTVVRDFFDVCYHSYLLFLKELRDFSDSDETQTLRFVHIPASIAVGIMGLIIEVPLYTIIAVLKSPYLLFMGWYRLTHDLISREGPFLETACIPIAGLTILLWPLVVVGSILVAIFSSFFVALYGSVIVYQERSFRRGAAYVIAMVAEFDEYTNDWLYLREGSILPKPRYRKKILTQSTEFSVGGSRRPASNFFAASTEAPAMHMPVLAPARSVREAIHEVKVVQIWEQTMKACEVRGKLLIDAKVIRPAEIIEWSKEKRRPEESIISVGLPSYSFLLTLIHSIKSGSAGLLLYDGVEVNNFNRPEDRLLDWFFQPVLILKEQIKVIQLGESEIRFLEKVVLCGGDTQRMDAWDNDCEVPPDPVRAAQIQGISRRLTGMTRSISKFPTYRRKYSQVIKSLVAYAYYLETGSSSKSNSMRAFASNEVV